MSKKGGSPVKPDDPDLIVSRGLQEMLAKEQRKTRSVETPRSGKSTTSGKKKTARGPGGAPNFVFCYLCGRQFGHSSIGFHRPQCYLKKMIEWERGDPMTRGPKPVDPETHEKRLKEKGVDPNAPPAAAGGAGGRGKNGQYVDAYNAAQMEAYSQNSLCPCPNCGRTFLPDRLQVHLRSCKPGASAKPVSRPSTAAAAASSANTAAAGNNNNSNSRGSAKSPSAARPSAGPTDADRPIKASGSYAIPVEAGEDSVPPGASAQGGERRAPKSGSVKAVGKRPSTSQPRKVSIEEPSKNSDEDSDDVEFTMEPIMPPSVYNQRRSSMSAVQEEAEAESSSPFRPAPMEQSMDRMEDGEVQQMQQEGQEGSMQDSYRQASPSQNLDASQKSNNLNNSRRSVGSNGAGSNSAMSNNNNTSTNMNNNSNNNSNSNLGNANSTNNASNSSKPTKRKSGSAAAPATEDYEGGNEGGEFGEGGTGKKITLNNVSRFKNVQSRFKMEQQVQESSLVPCQYCGRKFNPDRVEKHEGACIERNKPRPSAPKHSPLKAAPKKTAARKSVGATPVSQEEGAAAAKFCGGCGTKLVPGSKFCSSCGSKI